MRTTLIAFALLALAACTGDSAFPEPTGKGTIRAINAIKSSPDVSFRIEEVLVDAVPFRSASQAQRYDDFSYVFNFEVVFFGASEATRIASPRLKVDANRDYTILLTGTLSNPATTIWEADERTFDGNETVFEMRFAHAAPTLGAVDVYFAAPGVAPA